MEKKQIENTTLTLDDTNIPSITASLEMLTVDTKCSSPIGTKRLLRKRIPKSVPTEIPNRRCSLKPKKRTFTDINDLEENVKEYYLDKSIKKKPNNLETIYEESGEANDSIHMGAKRFKRMLLFKPEPTSSKLKKRRARIQKIFGSKISYKKRCTSMQTLLDKLDGIRANSPLKIDSENK